MDFRLHVSLMHCVQAVLASNGDRACYHWQYESAHSLLRSTLSSNVPAKRSAKACKDFPVTTVDDLLKTHGTPPPEVCFDWAMQLQDLLESLDHAEGGGCEQEESATSQPVTSSEPLAWAQVDVDAEGVLSIQAAPDVRDRSDLAALVMEAVEWSGCSLPQFADSPNAEVSTLERSQLISLTKNWLAEQHSPASGSQTSDKAASPVSTAEASKARSTSLLTAAGRIPAKGSSSSKANSKSRSGTGAWLYLSAAVAGCLVVSGLFWSSGLFSGNQLTDSSGPSGPREVAMAEPDEQQPVEVGESAGISGSSGESELVALKDWAAEADESNFADLDALGDIDLETQSAPPPADSEPESQLGSRDAMEAQAVIEPEGGNGGNPSDDREGTVGADDGEAERTIAEASEVDVMEAMNELAKETAGEVLESEVAGEVQANGDIAAKLPALELATFPMLQIQSVPQVRKLRAREPAWELSLQASDGFEVRPAKPLTLVAKDIVVWTIEETDPDRDSKSEPIQIVVRARMLGQRGERIQWSVTAEAKDLPGVQLPVSQNYLDLVQRNVLVMQQQLRLAIQNLKLLSSMQGLPRGAKSAMSQQRRGFESQLEIADRVMEMAADANRLEGWLDGQFEVNAVFSDARQDPSTTLLQFGNPDDGSVADNPAAVNSDKVEPKQDDDEKSGDN